MNRKFVGFLAVVASTAFLGLVSMPTVSQNDAEAGLLRRIFSSCGGGGGGGLQSYSSSCGGGGLQMYSSCSGGGGGLQYGTVQYYSAPAMQYQYAVPASGCPGGVCPPGAGGGLSYAPTYVPAYQTASVPVRLNPGEVYVAGSLREVTTTNRSALASAASKTESRPETRLSSKKPAETKGAAIPSGVVLAQITQDGCHGCEQEAQMLRQEGVKFVKLNMNVAEDAFKVVNYWGQKTEQDCELESTPAYMLIRDGVVLSKLNKPIGDKAGVTAMLSVANQYSPSKSTPLVKTEIQAAPAPERSELDRIESAMVKMSDNMVRMSEDVHALRTMLASAK